MISNSELSQCCTPQRLQNGPRLICQSYVVPTGPELRATQCCPATELQHSSSFWEPPPRWCPAAHNGCQAREKVTAATSATKARAQRLRIVSGGGAPSLSPARRARHARAAAVASAMAPAERGRHPPRPGGAGVSTYVSTYIPRWPVRAGRRAEGRER